MKLRHIALLAVLGTSLASPVFAQPASGQGMGPGAGKGPGMGPCATQGQGAGAGQGAGQGQGAGMGPCAAQGQGAGMGPGGGKRMQFNSNKGNTWGYQLMSPEERTVQRDKMRATKTYDECKALQDEHHKAMEVRAKEKGKTLPTPRNNGCDRMKAGGYFK